MITGLFVIKNTWTILH